MTRFYCTYFDANYLVRALALIDSLQKHETSSYCLFAVCLDEISRRLIERLDLPNVVAIPMHEIERGDRALLAAKQNRSTVEYYWTATPTIVLRLLDRYPEIDVLTYLDADLYFYSSPEPIFKELGEQSVLIHEHRFPSELAHLEPTSGKYNVGLLCFRNDPAGLQVLRWWRERCLEWCYAHYEDGKYGDQLYLNGWPDKFPGVTVLQNVGAGMAPWNHGQYGISTDSSGHALIDGTPLVFYHFHSLAFVTPELVIPIKHLTYPLSLDLLELCFRPYIEALFSGIEKVRTLLPDFTLGLYTANLLSANHTLVAKAGLKESLVSAGYPTPPFPLTSQLDCYYSTQFREFAKALETARGLMESTPEAALDVLRRVDSRFSESPALRTLQAELRYHQGAGEEAIAALRDLIQAHPTHMEARVDLAVILWETGEAGAALEQIVAAWETAPHDRSVVVTAGDLLVALERTEEARQVYRTYLRSHPDDEAIRSRLTSIAPDDYLVTAIVSTYNSEQFIRGCLEDLEAQSIADRLEIIVIDSGSPQHEGAIVKELQQHYPNIKYVRTEREPLYQAWNRAIRMATGKYVTNANTDDRHHPDALERMAEAMESDPEVALVYSHQLINDQADVPFHNSRVVGMLERPEYERSLMLQGCHMGSHPMWRRSVHDRIGYFDERLKSAGDYEFWCRMAVAHRLKLLPEVLSAYYYNQEGIELSNQGLSIKEANFTQHLYRNLLTQPIEVNYFSDHSRFRLVAPVFNQRDIPELEKAVGTYLRAFGPEAPISLLVWVASHVGPHQVEAAVLRAIEDAGFGETEAFADVELVHGDMETAVLAGLLEGSDGLVALPNLPQGLLDFAQSLDLPHVETFTPDSMRGLVGQWDPRAIDIVLLTHNRLAYLQQTVDALYERTRHPFRLTIVDNASDADVLDYLQTHRTLFHRVIRNLENRWTEAFTQGISVTRSDPFIVSDPDVLVPRRDGCWLSDMLGLMQAHPEMGMLALNLDASNKPTRLPDVYVSEKTPHGTDITLSNVGTVMQTIRRRFFLPPYTTDWQVVEAIRARGGLVGFANDLVGYHLGWDEDRDYPEHLVKKHHYFHDQYGSNLYRLYTNDAEILGAMSGDLQPLIAEEPLTSIVMLTWNQLSYTQLCIDSLFKHTAEPFELIVVDNGSVDGTVSYLSKLAAEHPNVKLILNATNRGFAGGCNQGIAASSGQYVLLLNNDTVVAPGWLTGLIEALKAEGMGAVGPRTNSVIGPQLVEAIGYNPTTLDGFEAFAQQWRLQHRGTLRVMKRIIGFCMLIRREVIDRIGVLDFSFGRGNFEDDDYCLRMQLAGFELGVAEDVFIHHFGSVTFRGQKIDYEQAIEENWQVFRKKWLLSDTPERSYRYAEALSLPFTPLHHIEPLFRPATPATPLPFRRGFNLMLAEMTESQLRNTLEAYLTAFTESDDVALHILAGAQFDRMQALIEETLSLLRVDPDHIPDVSLLEGPSTPLELPGYLKASDLALGSNRAVVGARDMGVPAFDTATPEAFKTAFAQFRAIRWDEEPPRLDVQARERWLVSRQDCWQAALGGYLAMTPSGSSRALLIPVEPGCTEQTMAAIATWLTEHGHDPENIPDVVLVETAAPGSAAIFRLATAWVDTGDPRDRAIAMGLGVPAITLAAVPDRMKSVP